MAGSHHLQLRLPGFNAWVEAGDAAIHARLASRYAGFIGEPDVRQDTLQVEYRRTGDVLARPGAFQGADLSGTELRVGPAQEPLAVLERQSGVGHVVPHASMLALDILLRSEMTLRALDAGGVTLHAAGVVLHGAAHVFAGVSGAGKSTVAAQLRNEHATVLCDEFLVLHRQAATFMALGTPFREGTPARAPVAALWHLGRGDAEVLPMAGGTAGVLRHLVRNLALPVRGPGLEARALAAAAAVAGTAPGFELRYVPGQPIFNRVSRAVAPTQQGIPQP